MKIADILKDKGDVVHKIDENDTMCQAVKSLNAKGIGSLVVVNEQQEITGIVTERDILKKFETVKDAQNVLVKTVMTPSEDMFIAHRDDNTTTIMSIMTRNKVRHIPVIEQDKVVGIISIGDIIHGMLVDSEQESRLLREYVKSPYGIPVV